MNSMTSGILKKAKQFQMEGKYSEAFTILEDFIKSLEPNDKVNLVYCLNEQCQCHFQKGSVDEAKVLAQKALKISKEDPSDLVGEATALNNLSQIYYFEGEFERSEERLTRCMTLTDEKSLIRANALDIIGNINLKQGNLDKAEEFYKQSFAIREGFDEPSDLGDSFHNFGAVAWLQGNHREAKEFMSRALSLWEKVGALPKVATSLNSLGVLSGEIGDTNQAEDLYLRSLHIREQIGNPLYISISLNNLANLYGRSGDFDKSIDLHLKCLELREKINNPQKIALTLSNLGSLYSQRGEIKKAMDFHQRSLALNEKAGYPQAIATSLNNLGEINRKIGELALSEELHRKAFSLSEELGNPKSTATSFYQLVKVLLIRDSIDDAMFFVDRLRQLAESSELPIINLDHSLATGILNLKLHELNSAMDYGLLARKSAIKISHFELQVDAILLIIQVLLQQYTITKQSKDLTKIKSFLHELEIMSRRERLHGTYVETLIIRGFLKRATLDFNGAEQDFQSAKLISKERGLRSLTQKAHKELIHLKKQIQLLQHFKDLSPEYYKELNLNDMISFISSMWGKEELKSKLDIANFFMLAIRNGVLGPQVFVTEEIPFQKKSVDGFFLRVGVFYSTAIGQGEAHYQGLYGPLPLTNDYSCLIYAKTIPDKNQKDPRMKKQTYTLLCLNFPKGQDRYLKSRESLEAIFEDYVSKLLDLSEMNLDFLQRLRSDLLS